MMTKMMPTSLLVTVTVTVMIKVTCVIMKAKITAAIIMGLLTTVTQNTLGI